mmetsp:Transcript_5834/g.10193  ORF Transcript_5834/g.10193 Transcript_5834/m.10193 type:complete len:908 (+) Transcript_5834:49-2772(+)
MTDEVKVRFQRDINCIADSDRSTRTRALKRIDGELFGMRSNDLFDVPGARSIFLRDMLLGPLIGCFADPVEKCRELSITMLKRLVEEDGNGGATDKSRLLDPSVVQSICAQAIQAMEPRLAETPFPEQSEEIRLELVELLTLLLRNPVCKDTVSRDLTKVARILAKTCGDNFPDNKKQCAVCCVTLCQNFPDMIHYHFESLIIAVLGNMSHQHAKVRQSSLEAVKHLVMTCAATSSSFDKLMAENIVPVLRRTNHDRVSSVRIQAMELISDLLLKMPNGEKYRKDLLPIILFGLADAAKQIQEDTLVTIEKVGTNLLASSEGEMLQDDEVLEPMDELPEPFTQRPGFGARILIVQTLDSVLPQLLKEAHDWTAVERFRAVALLRCILVFAENHAESYVEAILQTLFTSCRDDEQNVRDASMDCARLLGHFLGTEKLLDVLVPVCVGGRMKQKTMDAPEDAPSLRMGALCVLTGVIYGFKTEGLPQHLDTVVGVLNSAGLADSENSEILREVLESCRAVVDRLLRERDDGTSCTLSESTRDKLVWVLLILVSSPFDTAELGIRKDAEWTLADFALCLGFLKNDGSEGDSGPLVEICSEVLLCRTLSLDPAKAPSAHDRKHCENWSKQSSERRVFDEVVRRVGVAGLSRAKQVDLVVSVLLATSPIDRDPDLRLCMLSLLETMISSTNSAMELQNDSPDPLGKFLGPIVNNILLPNLVWRAGRVACTIRKVSMYCLSNFIGTTSERADMYFKEFDSMLPTIKSCLDDMEVDTRKFTCKLFYNLFALFNMHEKQLDPMTVTNMYHDIIKRLDDADDKVRIIACSAIAELCKVAPTSIMKGTPLDYITDTAFIHMDDQNPQVQQAVFSILSAAVSQNIDNKMILKKANTHRGRHRSPDWCDKVIAACETSA